MQNQTTIKSANLKEALHLVLHRINEIPAQQAFAKTYLDSDQQKVFLSICERVRSGQLPAAGKHVEQLVADVFK